MLSVLQIHLYLAHSDTLRTLLHVQSIQILRYLTSDTRHVTRDIVKFLIRALT